MIEPKIKLRLKRKADQQDASLFLKVTEGGSDGGSPMNSVSKEVSPRGRIEIPDRLSSVHSSNTDSSDS